MYLLSVAGLIACKDANLFEAFSCSWTPSSTFYKLLEIERNGQPCLLLVVGGNRLIRQPQITPCWSGMHRGIQ